MALMTKRKTVSFFEVTDRDGNPLPEPIKWPELLADLALLPAAERAHTINGAVHYGQVYPLHEVDHLVLARQREDTPTSYDLRTGDIIDAQTQASRPWVELSVIHFLPSSNKLGFVLGNQAGPRISSLEGWLNLHEVLSDEIAIRPAMSPQVVRKLQGETARAKLVKLKLTPPQLAQVEPDAGLVTAMQQMRQDLDLGDGIEVELTVKVRGRVDRAPDELLRGLARAGRRLLGHRLEAAFVELIDFTPENSSETELIDLIHHRLSLKEQVRTLDEEGEPVRIPSAITAIYRAAERLGDLLR